MFSACGGIHILPPHGNGGSEILAHKPHSTPKPTRSPTPTPTSTTSATPPPTVRPANSSTGVGCNRTDCSLSYLVYGDRLRLKSSSLSKMTCYAPSGGLCPQASALAQQWMTYGIIF